MARKKRSPRGRGEAQSKAGECGAPPRDDVPGRPLWVRIAALLILAGLVVALVLTYHKRSRPKTAIAREADAATPEMAALLREIDDVACSVVERFPDSPEALDVLARAHYRLGKQQDAEAYWHQCLELRSDFCPAIHSIGLLNLEIGNHAKAVEYFRKALDLEPGSPVFSVDLSQALIANGQAPEAIEILEKDVQLHPKALATLAMLGQAYLQDRQYAKAKSYFERAIVVGPKYSNAYNGLVTACANLGEEEKAKEYAAILKEIKAEEAENHRSRLKKLDDVRKVKGILSEIYLAAANVYLTQNEPGVAETYLLRSIENAPKYLAPHEVLTWLYQRQGRRDDAAKILKKLLTIAPDDVTAQMGCAAQCQEMGWLDEAEAAYKKVIEMTPEQAGGYAALAWLYINHNEKLPEARRLAEAAVEREPLAKHYYLLSVACRTNNDEEGMRAAMSRCMALDPGNQEYQKAWRMIAAQQGG